MRSDVLTPLQLFENWHDEEVEESGLHLSSACCLSTSGLDGYPNSRFVALKEIRSDSLVITGPSNSRKAYEIGNDPKVALAFWWHSTEKQIRVQGEAGPISSAKADLYFAQRNRDAQIVSSAFDQGEEIESLELLHRQFDSYKGQLEGTHIPRPVKWGGFSISPIRMEFMSFKKSRLHERILYHKVDGKWEMAILQP